MAKEPYDKELARLVAENAELRQRLVGLEEEIVRLQEANGFLAQHPTLAAGIKGETIVVTSLDGKLTARNDSADVDVDGIRVEVKFSKLTRHPSKRGSWTWNRIFGGRGLKKYDFLILIGEKDKQFDQHYLVTDKPVPYVMFCIPSAECVPLTDRSGGLSRCIHLNSNPLAVNDDKTIALFSRYQVTVEEMQRRFGL